MKKFATGTAFDLVGKRSLHLPSAKCSGNRPTASASVYPVMHPMGDKGIGNGTFTQRRSVITARLPTALHKLPTVLFCHGYLLALVRKTLIES
ncbi:MAG: hypothetical protein WC001_08085 [Desulfurivibrionaceae bacterium]